MKIRLANDVDLTRTFSASIRAGSSYNYETTLETHSNETAPTIRTISGFVVIVQPYEEESESNGGQEPKSDD